MKKIIFSILTICSLYTATKAQYISNVIEYVPAPGQYINTAPWGVPASANSLIGGIEGSLNLGAFGGYIIFTFENPVQNHPDNPYGVDFTIFSNAISNFSEAAVVYVMKDENENGIPDDTWQELAGSDYFFETSIHNYEVNYFNPNEDGADIPWSDNFGNTGVIAANSFHTQNYYPNYDSFPRVTPQNYILGGSYIKGHIDKSNASNIKSYRRAFGYADNNPRGTAPWTIPDNPYTESIENSGGDGFDISWAIDSDGNYLNLDEIHFIKVQNAMQNDAGWLGELSTEITGACVVSPNNTISGKTNFVMFETLPDTIRTENIQLNPLCFQMGRINQAANYSWNLSMQNAQIDGNNILNLQSSGTLEITIFLTDNPEISYSQTVYVEINNSISTSNFAEISIYPSPAQNYLKIEGISNAEIQIYNSTGKSVLQINDYQENQPIDVSDFANGIYLIKLSKAVNSKTYSFIINQ
ncbi:MAG: T9SS type A sorting domain-containing protein [Bacteroidota bacterium]|nr:T9SS type A sorting domain-containing protein [Bacteroidota bacterium]